MTTSTQRLRFGLFIPPIHSSRMNPTLALHRDIELIQYIERLGYDEVWIGEHHSAGWECIGSPELFLSNVAARTSRIRLGTGMVSLPYHHPLWSAERLVLLDHLSHGRAMFGVGPGSLPTDAEMMGLDPSQLRPRLEEAVDAVVALLKGDEPVNMETEWFTLKNARLQLRPYSQPTLEMAVAALVSPMGPRVAGKHGIGLLSIGATQKDGFDALAMHWNVVEEEAAHYRTTPDRSGWRLVGPMHVAETRDQARRDVEYGIAEWFYFMGKVSAVPQFKVVGETVKEMVDFIVEGGAGVIGTVEDAREQVARLIQQSGGFGCYLVMGNDWTTPEANRRSLELIARHVFPEFQASTVGLIDSERHALERHDDLYQRQEVALVEMTKRHEDERALRAPGWAALHPAQVAAHEPG